MHSIIPRRLLLALLALPLIACDSPATPPEQGEEELDISWLQQNAVPFTTTEPGGPYADLAPLGTMIGGARIAGLGEATHGTREFFRMKHRVLEYLVREKGFTTFGIEATWAEANLVNAYVHGGPGDPEVLLSNLRFWTWNTREVLAMIEWMRAHNQNPGTAPKVSFAGFDMQYSRVAMDQAETYLRRLDAAAADSVGAFYACYREFQDLQGASGPNYLAASPAVRAQCRAGVQAAHALLARRADELIARTDRTAFLTALRAARIVVQNEDLRATATGGSQLRDQYMAENVAWLADSITPGAKVVLWAHNGHVSRGPGYMGTHLTQWYGDAYRVVGFSFYRGEFSAVVPNVGLRTAAALHGEAPPESYNHQFHRLEMPLFLLDLRPLRAGAPAGAEWMLGPRGFRMVGATYDRAYAQLYFRQSALPQEYDVLIHVEQTTASQLMPFRYE
jgi:erythromycin esterase